MLVLKIRIIIIIIKVYKFKFGSGFIWVCILSACFISEKMLRLC